MRGAFIHTCSIFYGPESPYGTPGLQYAAGVPCRLVAQPLIDQEDFPLYLTDHWLTLQLVSPNTPKYTSTALGQWQARIQTSDRLVVSAVPTKSWYALRREFMTGPEQAPYERVALLDVSRVAYPDWLPPSPPPPPTPGTTCLTAAAAAPPYTYTGAQPMGQFWWWTFQASMGVSYTVTATLNSGMNLTTRIYHGTCGTLTQIGTTIIGSGSRTFTRPMLSTIYVEMSNTMGANLTLTIASP